MRIKETIYSIIISMRPTQWTKNFFIFAALIFVKGFLDIHRVILTFEAFGLFCIASSAIYIINDMADCKNDKGHPVKRLRPIAAGALPRATALGVACLFMAASGVGGWFVGMQFFAVVAAYMLLQLLYSFVLKRIVIIDVLAIAFGFVLRVIAGAVAIGVPFSVWLILCTFFLALFLAVSKRKNELLYGVGGIARGVLREYSVDFLNQMNMVVLPSTIITYAFYTFSSEHSRWLMVTIPVVVYGLFRYLFIMDKKRASDNGPSDDVLADRGLQITVLVWVTSAVVILMYGK